MKLETGWETRQKRSWRKYEEKCLERGWAVGKQEIELINQTSESIKNELANHRIPQKISRSIRHV